MNISLTPELEQLVNDKVASGMYHSASEVIREALRLLKEHDALREFRLQELRKEIAKGMEQSERGQTAPFDVEDMKRRVRERHHSALPLGLIGHRADGFMSDFPDWGVYPPLRAFRDSYDNKITPP